MKKGTLLAASTLAAAALMLPAPAFAGGGNDTPGHVDNDDGTVTVYWSLPDEWNGVEEGDELHQKLMAGWYPEWDERAWEPKIWPQKYDPKLEECGGWWQWDTYDPNQVGSQLDSAIEEGELNGGQVQELTWGFEQQPECGDEEVPEEEEETPDPTPTPDEGEEEDVPLTPIEPAEPVEDEEAPEEEDSEEEVVDEDETEEEETEEEEETTVEITSNEVKTPKKATDELPQTGSETTSATLIGAALIALGGGAYATSRMLRARGNTVKLRHQR